MAKQIRYVSIFMYNAPYNNANGVIIGNETLNKIVGEYSLFDNTTGSIINCTNGQLIRQFEVTIVGTKTVQQQWNDIISQIKTDEAII